MSDQSYINLLSMSQRQSVDSTGTMFFTKYSNPTQLNNVQRKRFRSTFQASRIGDQNKMNEIQDMFNNYNLFKYGQFGNPSTKKRHSLKNYPLEDNRNRHKNLKERTKENQSLKDRLEQMKTDRHVLFQRLESITAKNLEKGVN